MRILVILRLTFFALPLFALISCGYKLGGLEVIGDNQDKVAEVKILSPNNFKQSFINAGFTISSDNFLYLIKIDGPTYSKETTSVTSSATENEFTITGKIEVSLEDNKGNIIIQNKVFSLSKDHKFSSSNINSSESEENTIKSDIEKYLQIQVVNLVRSKI